MLHEIELAENAHGIILGSLENCKYLNRLSLREN